MVGKLAAVGLMKPRGRALLKAFLTRYMESRSDLKPASRRKLDQTTVKLLAFFDADSPLRDITLDEAAD